MHEAKEAQRSSRQHPARRDNEAPLDDEDRGGRQEKRGEEGALLERESPVMMTSRGRKWRAKSIVIIEARVLPMPVAATTVLLPAILPRA